MNRTSPIWVTALCISCSIEPPDIESFPDGGATSRIRYPDTVVSFGATDNLATCLTTALACDASQSECADQGAALGAPDQITTAIAENQALILANSCGAFLENGGIESMDVRIHGTPIDNISVVVDVSFDANRYVTLGDIEKFDEGVFDFDLGRVDLESFQFIRLTVTQGGPFNLDAIENLALSP
jgi:hypothetical protein